SSAGEPSPFDRVLDQVEVGPGVRIARPALLPRKRTNGARVMASFAKGQQGDGLPFARPF
ncbi:MAG TPA: hypothetical protein VMB83_04905, partial [Roseiarcus sp.]|nr:hypothetical protein [Roseiarcus sp.]